jgi:hypothetical protein
MNTQKMLTEMCQDILTDTDIKAICKSRGFSASEAASRTVFENFFLSDIGLETAMASLKDKEITLLYLLKSKTVDTSFFERLYGKSSAYLYGTFTQRYTPIFKNVQRDFVRKGLLIIATAPDKGGTKMERWRFQFPPVFEKFLPPLFSSPLLFKGKGSIKQDILEQKLKTILQPQKKLAFDNRIDYRLSLNQGQLLIGDKPFSAQKLLEWQQTYWNDSVLRGIKQPKNKVYRTAEEFMADTVADKELPPLLYETLSHTQPNQWINSKAITNLLSLFYNSTKAPTSQSVCEIGWRVGCLAKHTEKGTDYYRLAPIQEAIDKEPSRYLEVTDTLSVDLKNIPFESLAHLAAISKVQIGAGKLKFSPDFIRMGNAPEAIWEHPLTDWLKKNVPAYQTAMTKIAKRRGKQIVHKNLLIAKVRDLSLKVQIEKTFTDSSSVVFLPNDFIAFPPGLLSHIQKLVAKSGYVIKTVRAD